MSIVVQLLSCVWLFVTPWTVAHQVSLSFTISWSLLKLMTMELVMPSNHLILCHPLLLLPSVFPSIWIFSNESVLHIRWPKNIGASASTSVLPMNSQSWFPLGLTGLITLLSNSLSGVFPSPAIRNHQFFTTQLVNIGFNLKSPDSLASNKTVNLSFETLRPDIDFSFLAMTVLDGIFFQYNFIENLLFSTATFIHYLSCIFWITCMASTSAHTAFPYLLVMEMLLSFTFMSQPMPASNFSSAVSSPRSAFIELKRVS